MPKKKSFLARLTGIMEHEDESLEEEGVEEVKIVGEDLEQEEVDIETLNKSEELEEENEGELAVDVFQKPNEIVVKTMVAGVRPEDLDVSITREMVTIKGKRDRERHGSNDEYSYKELYWGAFARSSVLPEEIDVDGSEANVQNGLLIVRLPKVDKKRTQKLKILKA